MTSPHASLLVQGIGSLFVGTTEGCGRLLERLVQTAAAGGDVAAEARRIADEHRAARRPLPGFGHPQHTPKEHAP